MAQASEHGKPAHVVHDGSTKFAPRVVAYQVVDLALSRRGVQQSRCVGSRWKHQVSVGVRHDTHALVEKVLRHVALGELLGVCHPVVAHPHELRAQVLRRVAHRCAGQAHVLPAPHKAQCSGSLVQVGDSLALVQHDQAPLSSKDELLATPHRLVHHDLVCVHTFSSRPHHLVSSHH